MRFTATILEAHRNALKQHLIRPDGLERVALLICGRCQTKRDPWTGDREERFISREVIAIPDDSLLEQSTTRVRFPTSYVYRAAKQVEPKDLALAIVHSHPNGELVYSEIDDRDEPEAMAIIFNRNDGVRPHLSLLMDGRGEMIGRAYGPDLKPVPLHMLRVIGDRFDFRHGDRELANLPHLDRQRRAFGKAFSNDMRALRFGIVGAGATGSATALLLMRLGAGHIAVISPARQMPTSAREKLTC
jgi:proteasome lid subunit RPN8/RPN11